MLNISCGLSPSPSHFLGTPNFMSSPALLVKIVVISILLIKKRLLKIRLAIAELPVDVRYIEKVSFSTAGGKGPK